METVSLPVHRKYRHYYPKQNTPFEHCISQLIPHSPFISPNYDRPPLPAQHGGPQSAHHTASHHTSPLTHILSSMHRPQHARRTPLHPCSSRSSVPISAIASCDKVPFQGPPLCLRTVRTPCCAGAAPV
ncbi:uncharacterized protein CC84DRAFT_62236 [Paraphaeosphaeria sporulosa]|uniref:Uncharacterized protein n=1 Tax=Paraphaeosphaeria sporulosa TaxID=1460663 RepID=A0A177CYQ0_9PLEO|nr:uncharacterized protein CC84DRAFT_62236 [Paraphaeosphaeria sporulosa]OAG11940.1 hypothetical protein CC84DRAFT_62236 [Paraphaeosphaeria sporulosa]